MADEFMPHSCLWLTVGGAVYRAARGEPAAAYSLMEAGPGRSGPLAAFAKGAPLGFVTARLLRGAESESCARRAVSTRLLLVHHLHVKRPVKIERPFVAQPRTAAIPLDLSAHA